MHAECVGDGFSTIDIHSVLTATFNFIVYVLRGHTGFVCEFLLRHFAVIKNVLDAAPSDLNRKDHLRLIIVRMYFTININN